MDIFHKYWPNPWKRFFLRRWTRFWLKYSGHDFKGRISGKMAELFIPPFKERMYLAKMTPRGFIEPTARIYHPDFKSGKKCFIGDRVVIYDRKGGGKVLLGDHVSIYQDVVLETGRNGSIYIKDQASIHPSCYLSAFVSSIHIGKGVMLAPQCALYTHSHGTDPAVPIRKQPLVSKGPIVIEDEAWLGVKAIVLSGVTIGRGAVVAAGAVVTEDVPPNAIVVGNPAGILRYR